METLEQIMKKKQFIARCEKSLALEKLKKRKADTRRKIDLGGLVIKSGMDGCDKPTILGALTQALQLMEQDSSYQTIYKALGESLFLND